MRQFDPQWMALTATPTWTESNRRVTGQFQQFGLRPAGETELPRGCNGCGAEPPTAYVTVYTASAYDPSLAKTGQPVTVNAGNDGFFHAAQGMDNALLAWRYADNAWATVRGTTTLTSQSDRMLELARALHPGELTSIRTPLSLPDVPASMPLAEINVDHGEYGTTMTFAPCGGTDMGATPRCQVDADSLRVQIWPTDDLAGHTPGGESVSAQIGGRDGSYSADGKTAVSRVAPGMVTVFELDGAGQSLRNILETLEWAPDPVDEQTWYPVSDWSRPQ